VLSYFNDSFTTDTTVMTVAIEAVEKYGWREVVEYYFNAFAKLPLTDESAAWVISQLEQGIHGTGARRESFCRSLEECLTWADVEVLRPLRERILGVKSLAEANRPTIQMRLDWSDVDSEGCWREIESLADQIFASTEKKFPSAEVHRAEAIVSVLAPRAGEYTSRVLDLLGLDLTQTDIDRRNWLQGMMIFLAGRMRLPEAAPHLVQRIYDDWDWYSEECQKSLKRIGGEAALDAIAAEYDSAPWHVRLFCAGALETIRGENAVQRLTQFAGVERQKSADEPSVGMNISGICVGLARQYDTAALAAARELILEYSYDSEVRAILPHVVGAYLMLGESVSELDAWKAEIEQTAKRQRQWARQLQEPHLPPRIDAAFATPSIFVAPTAAAVSTGLPDQGVPKTVAVPAVHTSVRVGRNEPCPCGSGKKFKKCCMRKSGPG
jgi:hypothetical protein